MNSIRTAIAIAAMTAGALLTAASANADPADYLDTMHTLGFYGVHGDESLLRDGFGVCNSVNAGVPAGAVVDYIYDNTDSSINYTDAENVVVLALHDLCPPTSAV